MRPLLHLRGVDARYGALRALEGVSLVVPESAVVALLGPNGAGKSTLLRTVSGMMRPARGVITFAGKRIDRLPPHAIARMGLTHIPEGRGIFPGLSVRENLMMAGYAVRNGAPQDLTRVFELFPVLESRRDQLAGTLSGGEQQMLSVARAVIVRPRLLLIDELSLGLAPTLVSQLFETLEKIRREGTSILLVEQYVRHALRLADIVVIMHKGRMEFIGEPGELSQDEKLVEAYLGTGGTASMAITGGPTAEPEEAVTRPRARRKPRRAATKPARKPAAKKKSRS